MEREGESAIRRAREARGGEGEGEIYRTEGGEVQMWRRRRGSMMRTGWNYTNEKTERKDEWGGSARRKKVKSNSVQKRCDLKKNKKI